VVIKVFFAVLVLCTVAVVAVILAIHFRVKRHLSEAPGPPAKPGPEAAVTEGPKPASADANGEQQIDRQLGS